MEEGDFTKRQIKPAYIAIGAGAVLAIGAMIYVARQTAETTLRPEEVHAEVRRVLVRPLSEQLKEWRRVLKDPKTDERMRQEAIFQLARLRDKESLPTFIQLLPDANNHATIRVLSMALIEFPRADGQPAVAALRKKLDNANNEDQPQIAAALTYLRDKESFKKILEIYKKEVMVSARGVDGSSSFDPEELALLTDRATFRSLSKDEQAGVRQLVATVLSNDPTKEDLSVLVDLLQDKDIEVSSAASVGIAKLDDPTSSKILVTKLAEAEKTDNETARKRYVEALKNGMGGTGLVWALKVVPYDVADLESRGRFILEELRELADPAAAPEYKKYLADTSNPPHYRAQIALALADVGDPDAVKYLAQRLDAQGIGFKCDGEEAGQPKCLSKNLGWKRQPPVDADPVTYREQQFSAQDIGDLATLFPERKAEFLRDSASHLKKFNSWFPAPWLVVSRALVYLGDSETLDWCKKNVREYKLPDDKLVNIGNDPTCPKDMPGCTIFRINEFTTASRYVGHANDPALINPLAKFLARPKDKKGNEVRLNDTEMELAQNPGYREVLRNLAQAAADGFAEWGEPANKGLKDLIKLVKDKDHGSFPRLMAGRAVGMVGSDKDVLALMKDAAETADLDAKVALLMAAQIRATPEIGAAVVDMIKPTQDPAMLQVNTWAARVVGWSGTKGLEDKLIQMLDDKEVRVFAALAITLGGDEDLVRRGMVTFEQKSRAESRWESEINSLRNIYLDTFDSRGVTAYDVDTGRLFRFVRNANIMKRAGASDDRNDLGKTSHEWASIYLSAGFKRLDMNATVPGGMDKLVLRYKLNKAAKTGDDATKQAAIETLKFLREQGSIMALRSEPGATGELAKRAFFELRHPEIASGPGDKEKEKADPYFSKPKK